jgi:hypothetical protein
MLCTLSAALMLDALGQFLRDQRVQTNPDPGVSANTEMFGSSRKCAIQSPSSSTRCQQGLGCFWEEV